MANSDSHSDYLTWTLSTRFGRLPNFTDDPRQENYDVVAAITEYWVSISLRG